MCPHFQRVQAAAATNSQFHITKIPRPASKSPAPTNKFNFKPTFLLLKSAHLSICNRCCMLLLLLYVVVVLHELLLLLLLQETELSSLNIVCQS